MSTPLRIDFSQSFQDGLKSKTLTSCSRWAAYRRIMSGDFAGNYSDKFHPWVRELHDSRAWQIYAMKGAQLGVTEVAINRAFYTIDRLKRDVLYVLPNDKVASDFSKGRFNTALALSPYLKRLFTDTNSVNMKQAGSCSLYIRGSKGEGNLVSIPVSELILDEVDRMDEDKLHLAYERLSGQLEKHIFGISTPTIPEYGIHKLYMGGTQEHFVFPCPGCSRRIELVWPDSVEIIGESPGDPRCAESFLKCQYCAKRLEHELKPDILSQASWEVFNKEANPEIRTFHISQLYSFTVTPGELVAAYLAGFGSEFAAQEFANSKLGNPFIGDGSRVDDAMLANCIGEHSKQDIRPEAAVKIITMGLDRGTWNHYEIVEWEIPGWTTDINSSAIAKVLYEGKFHEEDFEWKTDELMREWQVWACVLDPDPGVMEARRFCRRFPGYVFMCRYRRGQVAREISETDEGDGAVMLTVDRAHWLSASLGRFKAAKPRIILPRDVSEEYKSHMKALVSCYSKNDLNEPVLDFKKLGADHFAHARTYAEIALPMVAAREMNMDISKFR